MKTLDEIIKKFEICNGSENICFECPYNEERCSCDPDALYYLKEYRDECNNIINVHDDYIQLRNEMRDKYGVTSQKLRNTSQITCPECHSEFVILPDANNPLTWDELKSMEGKPVWVEWTEIFVGGAFPVRDWFLVEWISDNYEAVIRDRHGNQMICRNGGDWQAYRKERENETD